MQWCCLWTPVLLGGGGSRVCAKAATESVSYTERKILQAKKAQHAMGMKGNPIKGIFKNMVRGNMIKNCPMSTDAITNAHYLWPKCTNLWPKCTKPKGKHGMEDTGASSSYYVLVPRDIVEQNKTVTLAADIFFVDGIAFLLTVLRQIKLITVEHVATCTAKSLSKH
jgi:hypothetical protein